MIDFQNSTESSFLSNISVMGEKELLDQKLMAIRESAVMQRARYARLYDETELNKKDLEKTKEELSNLRKKTKDESLKELVDLQERVKTRARIERKIREIETLESVVESLCLATDDAKEKMDAIEFELEETEKEVGKWGRLYEFKINER